MEKLINKTKNNIQEYNLIEKGDSILVGFSGGPDSTALLLVLHALSAKVKFSLGACYINHMIRPRAAKKEIAFCWSICEKLKIDFHIINEDIPALAKKLKQSIETAARHFRLSVLRQLADENGYTKIALGHHKDDLIETLLFRLFRGTGPQGLDPIKPMSGKFIRPFLNIERHEIDKFLENKKIIPILDKSNLESKYSRNYIRNKVIPVIERHFKDKYKGSIYNFSRIITEENRFLSEYASKRLKKIKCITPGGKIVVDLKKLKGYDIWLRRRILKQILEDMAGHPGAGTFRDIENIEKLFSGGKNSANLAGGIYVAKDKELLIFSGRKIHFEKMELHPGKSTTVFQIGAKIAVNDMPLEKSVRGLQKSGFKINIDFAKTSSPLFVRSIKPGDRFSPLGMKGSKKIGNFLTDRKVSRYVRDEIPVVVDGKGIIWIVGMQISDRVKIDNTTKRALGIEYFAKKGGGNSKIRSALFPG